MFHAAEVTRSLSKVFKLNDCYTTSESYLVRQIVFHPKPAKAEQKRSRHLEDAKAEAERLVQKACSEAKRILQSAKEEADDIRERARSIAYEEGFIAGKKEAQKQTENILAQANELLEMMVKEKYDIISGLERQIIALCIKISEKIIGQQIKLDQKKFLSIISEAIKKAAGAENVTILVSPGQYDNVAEYKQALLSKANGIKSIDIFKNNLLGELDCLIETECGAVDSSVSTQLEKISQLFEVSENCV